MGLANRIIGSAAAGLLVLGCIGASPTRAPRLFVLDATASATGSAKRDVSIGVGPVSLPKRLDRPQIVTRTGDHEVALAEFDQWAEPLDRSFARAVAENLARSIPTDRVSVYPWRRNANIDWKIEIEVTRFEQETDGSVTLAVRWHAMNGDARNSVQYGAATFQETPERATPDALVDAMSRAVGALSARLAEEITTASQ